MASAEAYRRYAAECVRVAQQTDSPSDKALLLGMAEMWIRLAEQVKPTVPEGGSDLPET
jgi:hypothetical protein